MIARHRMTSTFQVMLQQLVYFLFILQIIATDRNNRDKQQKSGHHGPIQPNVAHIRTQSQTQSQVPPKDPHDHSLPTSIPPVAVVEHAKQLNHHTTFLKRNYSAAKWEHIKSALKCISTHGHWVNQGSTDHHGKLYDKVCSRDRYSTSACELHQLHTRPAMNFTWEAAALCSALHDFGANRWSREKMCSMLAKKKVYVVGDSIADEFFTSLVSALTSRATSKCDATNVTANDNICSDLGVKVSLIYERNDYLLINDQNGNPYVGENHPHCSLSVNPDCALYGRDWYRALAADGGVDLLIINRGAHYIDDDHTLRELYDTLTWLTTQYPRTSIIYRSTGPGHGQCKLYWDSLPLASHFSRVNLTTGTMNDQYASLFHDDDAKRYSWNRFAEQNIKIQNLLKSHFPQVLFIDVYPSTALRPDSHCYWTKNDCLHYCIPGPIDNWIVLLFNALRLLELHHQ